jgi:hypothetical protein
MHSRGVYDGGWTSGSKQDGGAGFAGYCDGGLVLRRIGDGSVTKYCRRRSFKVGLQLTNHISYVDEQVETEGHTMGVLDMQFALDMQTII